jgi:hypothetical protein
MLQMKKTARRGWKLGAAALLTLPGFAIAGSKVLTTSAIDFRDTLSCSATNVGTKPVSVTIELLSPGSGAVINAPVTTTLNPGFGTSNEFTLSVGYTSGYCRVTVDGSSRSVRAAACSKAAQNTGCQGVSEAR